MPEIDVELLGRQVASHIIDAFNAAQFGDALAEKVADQVVERVEIGQDSPQGWAQEYILPAWSGHCIQGEHDRCNGTAPPSESGCHCPHHRGEAIAELGYRLVLVERTADDFRAEGGGR